MKLQIESELWHYLHHNFEINLSSFSILKSIASNFAMITVQASFMPMLFGGHTVKMLMKKERPFYMEFLCTMSIAPIVSKWEVCGLIL